MNSRIARQSGPCFFRAAGPLKTDLRYSLLLKDDGTRLCRTPAIQQEKGFTGINLYATVTAGNF
jgi:hypothetical protein